MAARAPLSRVALGHAYAKVAARYWLGVFPAARREMAVWDKRAEQIPDPQLREFARQAGRSASANVEGAAAFAVLAPRPYRAAVVRATVAFETLSHYLDVLSEQPQADSIAYSNQLHQALLAALNDESASIEVSARGAGDGGYVAELVHACSKSLAALPSYPQLAAAARRAAKRCIAFQRLNLPGQPGGHADLESWAQGEERHEPQLRWWETGAAAVSTLGTLALLATSARPGLADREVRAITDAYWPWVDALSALLDSAADEAVDEAAGRTSFISYYDSPRDAAGRVRLISEEAMRRISVLPNSAEHAVLVAGMIGSYASLGQTSSAGAAVADGAMRALGFMGTPTLLMFKARRAAGQIGARPRARQRP